MAQQSTISKKEKVQTAVEWLIEQTYKKEWEGTVGFNTLFEQAKQMEKEQIIKAHDDGDVWSGEKYYNETYGK